LVAWTAPGQARDRPNSNGKHRIVTAGKFLKVMRSSIAMGQLAVQASHGMPRAGTLDAW
jgi:hypothetical protein